MAKEAHKPTNKWFKSGRTTFAGTGNIDAENGVLSGVIMCQVGEALGHGVWLEQSFIDDGIKKASKSFKKGMKARFGHPSMSNETLGSEMGRFKNFRVEDDKMVADLHLFESANISPTHPGMRDWMISQAQEDPEAIMCSIVFKPLYEYQYDDDGKRVNIWYCDQKGRWSRCRNQNGEVTSYNPNEKLYVDMDDIYFCDIVDQGAATDKLFSANFNSDKFSVIATEFLNEHPKVDVFIQENPEKLLTFLQNRYAAEDESEESGSEQSKGFNLIDWIREKFQADKPKHDNPLSIIKSDEMDFKRSLEILGKENPTAEELGEIKAQIEQFTGANEKFTKEELDAKIADAVKEKGTELQSANDKVQELTEKVEALEKATDKPEKAPKPTQEELETAGEPEEESYSVKKANEDLGE